VGYTKLIRESGSDPARLEEMYQESVRAQTEGGFADALQAAYTEEPDNLLYAAWHYRLVSAAAALAAGAAAEAARHIPWLLAVALAAANGVLLWLLSDASRFRIRTESGTEVPYFLLLWGPLVGAFVLAYLARTGALTWRWWGILAAALAVTAAYGLTAYMLVGGAAVQEQYVILAVLQTPVIAWTCVGIGVLHGLGDTGSRFAFLLKSLEIFVLGGLFLSALVVLTMVTIGLFQALGIRLPELAQQLLIVGGAGMIPLLAVAILYDPARPAGEQTFDGGLIRLLQMLLRLFLPVTAAVLVVYLCIVPFFFWRPFENRDVLIIYNAMLFAVMALLVGVTPYRLAGIGAPQQRWLRRGIIAVAALAGIVSIYALAAISYRTLQEGLTPNRLTFIGWNLINTGLLVYLLVKQIGKQSTTWLGAVHQTFGIGALLYAAWSTIVVFGLPWLF
jgi:hypothetical protein